MQRNGREKLTLEVVINLKYKFLIIGGVDMHIHVLFGQREESYPGQHEPEILASLTSDQLNRDPKYFDRVIKTFQIDCPFQVIKVVRLDVSGPLLRQLLMPAPEVLSTTVHFSHS